jgi:formylglycine-generating enzyme required for sulfatase activity/tRNA A-37 threonylcarbamoyl transferase component Bud32
MTEDQTPAIPPPQDDGTPKPTRIPVSKDPTMPIRLTSRGTPPPITPKTPRPAAPPAKGNAGDDGLWIGAEQTLVGGSPAKVSGQNPAPAAASDDQWLGSEQTALPVNRPSAASGGEDDGSWIGQEHTMVGAPVPAGLAPGGADGGDDWVGRDATVIGTPRPSAKAIGPKGDTTSRGGLGKKTNPTMDDGWHLKGRQGALTGRTIGDYEVGGILGEGGMGTVYRARQISLKRRVALKVLPPNLAQDLRLKERFEQEARTASLLNSPHVVQVFAAGSHEDLVYFVMEFVEGTDLSEKMREKQDAGELFTPDEAANFIIQSARGLAEAGKHNIVHRDIKPANLMITTKGVVKIADFGISKIAGEHGLTMTGTAVGTPAYCSPEQGRGEQVDVRADIYSLGVVYYELLTGKKPFDGTSANALIYQHNYAEPKLITDLRAEVPNSHQAVVLKCMQKDPAKRYQDAAELVADLERVRAGSAPMTALMNAFGTGADEAMRRLGIKQRRLWPYVAAALLLVVVGGGGVIWQTRRTAAAQTLGTTILHLRENLKGLDQRQPVSKGNLDDLASLAGLVAQDDTDLLRWQGKLQKVEALKKRLERLDATELPNVALRTESVVDLDRYREEVGGEGEDVDRWKKKIDDALGEIELRREELAEIDKGPVVSDAQTERLTPALQKLALLAGDQDDDVKRWTTKLAGSRDRAGQLRQALAALDDPKSVATETRLNRHEQDLAALTAIVGAQDPAVRGWTAKVQAGRDAIARLRKNLGRLDAVEWAITSLQAALKPDLDIYATLVDANDPKLKEWTRKIADSQARIAGLRKTLARLDQPAALTVAEQKDAEDQLAAYRALVSPDDGQLQAWSVRLRDEHEALAALSDTIRRFSREERMTVVELDNSTKAVEALARLGGISEAQKRLYDRRLADERQKLDDVRQFLRSRDAGGEVAVDQELVDALNQLAQLTGEGDEDVKRWRGKVIEYERLRGELVAFDQAVSVPENAKELLDAYVAIVGKGSAEVKRWRAKLAKVNDLRRQLTSLDQVAPLPEHALANARSLVAEVGEKDPQAKAWLGKATRVTELIGSLEHDLADAYVLPSPSSRQSAELVALVGTRDEQVARLMARVITLTGPGQPAWASAAGRDDYGPWSELTIKGVTQRFRYIPCGTFIMGSPDSESGRNKDEPRVRVTLSRSFWLADTECTQAFWNVVAGGNDSRFPGLERPVERVSWVDCKTFCVTLSSQVRTLTARLPTEAEWEYACRAGVQAPYVSYLGPIDLPKLDTVAWYAATSKATQGVKRRFGNALGLFDMHGNVWEWCEDRYGTYSPTPVTDPVGREQETRVARGGSWGDAPESCRAANRLAVRPDMRTLYLGFRLAAAVEWPNGQDPGMFATSTMQAPLIMSRPTAPPAIGAVSAPPPSPIPAAQPVKPAPAAMTIPPAAPVREKPIPPPLVIPQLPKPH